MEAKTTGRQCAWLPRTLLGRNGEIICHPGFNFGFGEAHGLQSRGHFPHTSWHDFLCTFNVLCLPAVLVCSWWDKTRPGGRFLSHSELLKDTEKQIPCLHLNFRNRKIKKSSSSVCSLWSSDADALVSGCSFASNIFKYLWEPSTWNDPVLLFLCQSPPKFYIIFYMNLLVLFFPIYKSFARIKRNHTSG